MPDGNRKSHAKNGMKRAAAVTSFVGVCIILALPLLAQILTVMLSGIVFAIALMTFGGLSRGFRRNSGMSSINQKEPS